MQVRKWTQSVWLCVISIAAQGPEAGRCIFRDHLRHPGLAFVLPGGLESGLDREAGQNWFVLFSLQSMGIRSVHRVQSFYVLYATNPIAAKPEAPHDVHYIYICTKNKKQ